MAGGDYTARITHTGNAVVLKQMTVFTLTYHYIFFKKRVVAEVIR